MSIYERKASLKEFYGKCFGNLCSFIGDKPNTFCYWGVWRGHGVSVVLDMLFFLSWRCKAVLFADL